MTTNEGEHDVVQAGVSPQRDVLVGCAGPIQVIWNRPNGGPLVWLTTRTPKLLVGRM